MTPPIIPILDIEGRTAAELAGRGAAASAAPLSMVGQPIILGGTGSALDPATEPTREVWLNLDAALDVRAWALSAAGDSATAVVVVETATYAAYPTFAALFVTTDRPQLAAATKNRRGAGATAFDTAPTQLAAGWTCFRYTLLSVGGSDAPAQLSLTLMAERS